MPKTIKYKLVVKSIIITSIALLFIFSYHIFFNKPLFIAADQQLTYHLFYEEWIRLIRNFISSGELPFYSWSKFLGSDFYSSASIYVTGDIFLPILLLFKNIDNALFFELILLIYISSLCFSFFLISFGIKKENTILIMSFVYAFSGIATLYFGNYMFLRFYAFLPLLFAGVERYVQHGKFGLFIFSVFLLSITSLYFMFPTSLFLVVYFTFSYFYNKNKSTITNYLFKSIKLIAYYLLGFLLSSFLSIPSILYILNNSRVGNSYDTSLIWEPKVLIGFVLSHISAPFALYTNIPFMFYSGNNGHGTWYSVYASTFVIAVIFTYLFLTKDKNKKYFSFLLLSTLLILLFKPVNSIFHAFSEPTLRLVFLYVFVIIFIASYILDNFESLKIKLGYSLFSALLAFVSLIGLLIGIIDLSIFKYQIIFILCSYIFGWSIIFIYESKFRKYTLFMIMFELILSTSIVTWSLNSSFYNYVPSLTKEYLEYYQSIDVDKMYRIYINPTHLLPSSELNLNQSLHYNYLSVSSYDSAYEPNLSKFLSLNNINWHIIHLNNPDVLRMLGVKYFIVYDESELPSNFEFEYVYNLDFLKVYKLKNYRSIGFTYSQFSRIDNLDSNSSINWNDIAYLYDDDLMKIEDIESSDSVNLNVVNSTSSSFFGSIELKSKQLLFLSIPYNSGWKVLDNNVETEVLNVNGGFTGIVLDKGYHSIEMYFVPNGLKVGTLLSIFAAGIVLIVVIRKRNGNKNDKIGNE